MADFCTICDEEIGEQPITELLCHHFFHTTCILNMFTMHPQNHHLQCVTCQEPFFTVQAQPAVDEEQDEDDETDEEEEEANYWVRQASERVRVTNLYDTDPKVRELIKKYKTAYREVGKPRTQYAKLVMRKKEQLSNFADPLFQQIRERQREINKDVFNSLEYKTFRQKDAALMRYYNKLQSTYNITSRSFHFLHDKRGCRGLRRPSYFNRWRVRRNLRLRYYF
jgi:hypothetical protein